MKHAAIHGSQPFSLMFARAPNQFRDYRNADSGVTTPTSDDYNAAVDRIKQMEKVIVPAIRKRIRLPAVLRRPDSTPNVAPSIGIRLAVRL